MQPKVPDSKAPGGDALPIAPPPSRPGNCTHVPGNLTLENVAVAERREAEPTTQH